MSGDSLTSAQAACVRAFWRCLCRLRRPPTLREWWREYGRKPGSVTGALHVMAALRRKGVMEPGELLPAQPPWRGGGGGRAGITSAPPQLKGCRIRVIGGHQVPVIDGGPDGLRLLRILTGHEERQSCTPSPK